MLVANLWYSQLPPLVEIHDSGEVKLVELGILSNKKFSEKTFCVGYDVGGRNEPHGVELSRGYRCQTCQDKDFFKFCGFCKGDRCLNQNMESKAWCNQPFVVYLAYFGGKTAKVGVSSESRVLERLHEQGALSYKILHKTINGREARKIETGLVETFPDRISQKQKLELYSDLNLSWFHETFEGLSFDLDYNLSLVAKLKSYKRIASTLINSSSVIGALGPFLIFENELVSFGKIKGRKIVPKRNLDYFFKG